jgi:O-antigen ligase
VIPNVIHSKKDLQEMMKVIVFSGVLLIFVSIKTVLQGYTVGTRLQVLNVNENAIGMNLLLSVFAAIWLEQNSELKHKNLFIFLTAIFLLASIAITGLSGSRGSAISWGISILIITFFKPTRRWGTFSLLIIAVAALFVPSIFTTTIERFLVVQGDTALGGREFLWPAALRLIKDHFFLGVGIGNSQFEMVPYLLVSGARTVMRSGEPIHNPILVIWAETGIIGLAMYLGILGSVLVSFLKNWKNSISIDGQTHNSYFPIMAAVAIGFLSSWIKGGGMESSFTFFLLISILLSSSVLVSNTPSMKKEND